MQDVLGIDIAKAKFDVTLRFPDGKRRRKAFQNTVAGFRELAAWLERQGVARVHAAVEATGTYAEALATWLVDAGHAVSVLHPAAMSAYAHSQLARAKTDRVDADLIADYTAKEAPPLWAPLPREVRELQALIRRLDVLITMQTQEQNRLSAGALVPAVQTSIEGILATLHEEIRAVKALIKDHIDTHPDLRQKRDLLVSIPGIGPSTAAILLGELLHKPFTRARQAAAYAGVTPRIRESGTWRGRARLSKMGPSRLRHALYFPAITAMRCNPSITPLRNRLVRKGKPKMLIIGAAMRKLVHLAYGVLKSGRAYSPVLTA